MPLPYSEIVMEHFKRPHNVGRIEEPDGKATEGSPACGDMVSVYLKIDEATQRIDDIKFESYGCASNIATGSIITELAKGKTLEEAKTLTWRDASDALGGLPAIKAHCSVLAIDGLRSAIENYEERHGLIKERIPTTEEIIRKRLKRVMNPVVGLDIVRTNLVQEVDWNPESGVARIVMDLPAGHQFANNIKDEIVDKIEPLWDVNQVIVEFVE
ncbi:MAG: iron-sulfur cluster assembly scaffold protein [Chloroflexi bacterium]|nr:iron-sulfur cluster assembly scaffold protein [Chloroflexota bacterium]MBU1750580.1 iron-sulfur cluster assembly scaffold protein [Chloroflexota bacterium]